MKREERSVDPLIGEVRERRPRVLGERGFDLARLLDTIRRRQAKHPRPPSGPAGRAAVVGDDSVVCAVRRSYAASDSRHCGMIANRLDADQGMLRGLVHLTADFGSRMCTAYLSSRPAAPTPLPAPPAEDEGGPSTEEDPANH